MTASRPPAYTAAEALNRLKAGNARFVSGQARFQVLGPALVRLFAWTWRVDRRGAPGLALLRGGAPSVIVLWHGRMLAAMPLWPHHHRGFAVLV